MVMRTSAAMSPQQAGGEWAQERTTPTHCGTISDCAPPSQGLGGPRHHPSLVIESSLVPTLAFGLAQAVEAVAPGIRVREQCKQSQTVLRLRDQRARRDRCESMACIACAE